jgi:hypothetical protein
MVAQLSSDLLDELDRGGTVQFEDPRTRARYVLIPQADYRQVLPLLSRGDGSATTDPVDWNEEKNARRCALVAKRHSGGGLSAAEEVELDALQNEMYRHRAAVAPLPLAMLEVIEAGLQRLAEQKAAVRP